MRTVAFSPCFRYCPYALPRKCYSDHLTHSGTYYSFIALRDPFPIRSARSDIYKGQPFPSIADFRGVKFLLDNGDFFQYNHKKLIIIMLYIMYYMTLKLR